MPPSEFSSKKTLVAVEGRSDYDSANKVLSSFDRAAEEEDLCKLEALPRHDRPLFWRGTINFIHSGALLPYYYFLQPMSVEETTF